jgi:hypothetical protein
MSSRLSMTGLPSGYQMLVTEVESYGIYAMRNWQRDISLVQDGLL